jgi:hypothetical protein
MGSNQGGPTRAKCHLAGSFFGERPMCPPSLTHARTRIVRTRTHALYHCGPVRRLLVRHSVNALNPERRRIQKQRLGRAECGLSDTAGFSLVTLLAHNGSHQPPSTRLLLLWSCTQLGNLQQPSGSSRDACGCLCATGPAAACVHYH